MDLICTTCGEPWDLDYVLHEEPEGFRRKGAAIVSCPSCPSADEANKSSSEGEELEEEERERLAVARELGEMLGDDVDGYTAELEDLGLT